jgi:glyoxylase-like metal-dependent hydrolase (beta-lactamase superfamily II)
MTVTRFDAPLPGGSPGAEVRVHPLSCGSSKAPLQYFGRPRGPAAVPRGVAAAIATPKSRWPTIPFPAFLVEHPTAGPFMIDTGPARSHAEDGGREDLGRVGAALLGVNMRPEHAAGEQVRALGHDPASIELVVMTHLHYDHLGGSDQFPNAEFLVTKAEHHDPPSTRNGTYPHHREAVKRWRVIGGNGEAVGPLTRTWDVFGDGSVRLASTPGHSPGHASVLLRLAGGRPALLAADAAYARRTIDERLVPLLCPDVERYLRSLDELRAYVDQTPDAVVVCGHDGWRWEQDSGELAAASSGAQQQQPA